jgi:four helix bundle protein
MKPSHKTLFVWQASVDVAARVLQLTEAFSNRRLALADQMQRAATSVPSNIAEGHGRLTERERRRFLGIARGSLHELDTQLEIAVRAGLIPATTQAELMTVLPESAPASTR